MRTRLFAPLAYLFVTACSTGAPSPAPDASPSSQPDASAVDAPSPGPDVPAADAARPEVSLPDVATPDAQPDVSSTPDVVPLDAPIDAPSPIDAALDAAPSPDVAPMPDVVSMPDVVAMPDAPSSEWTTGTYLRRGAGRLALFRGDDGTLHVTASVYTAATLSNPARTQLVYGTYRAGAWAWEDIAEVRMGGEYLSSVVVHRGVPYVAYMLLNTLAFTVVSRDATGWHPEPGIPADPPPVTPAYAGGPRLATNGTQLVFTYEQFWSSGASSRKRVLLKSGDSWGTFTSGPSGSTALAVVPAGPRANAFAYGAVFTRDAREVAAITYIDPVTGATNNTAATITSADWAGPERFVQAFPLAVLFRPDGSPTLAFTVTYECGPYACDALHFANASGPDPLTLTLRSTLFDRTLAAGFNGVARGPGGVTYFAYANREEVPWWSATVVTLRGDGTTARFDVPTGSSPPNNFLLPSSEAFGFAVDPSTRRATFVTTNFGVTQGTLPE